MTLDTKLLFEQHFDAAVREQQEKTSVPTEQWRRTGRATKAYPDKEGPEFWADHGPGMLDGYIAWRREHQMPIWVTPQGTPAIELDLTTKPLGPGLPPLRGFVDRVFVDTSSGALVVADLKTGKPPYGPRQLGLYKVMIEDVFPDTRVAFGAFWLARKNKMSGLVDLTRYTKKFVTDYVVAPYVLGVKARAFSPVPSNFCGTCVVRDYCPEYGTKYDLIPPY